MVHYVLKPDLSDRCLRSINEKLKLKMTYRVFWEVITKQFCNKNKKGTLFSGRSLLQIHQHPELEQQTRGFHHARYLCQNRKHPRHESVDGCVSHPSVLNSNVVDKRPSSIADVEELLPRLEYAFP